ncbi:MAG: hypothetical protein HY082_04365 [Gammaproteobacteria bacterium]|nr:hypothetical protein [Gammaproteobacteria bacterium]
MKTTKLTIVVLLWLGMWGEDAFALNCVSKQTGFWNAGGTWNNCGAGGPVAGDNVTISAGHTVTLAGGGASATDVTINAGGTISDGNQNLTMSGNLVMNGLYDSAGGGGRLIMTGANVTIDGTGTFNNIDRLDPIANTTKTILATANLTFIGAKARIDVRTGNTVINNGTVTLKRITGASATSVWTNAAGATLNISEDLLSTGTLNASAANNTVNYNGTAAQTVKVPSGAPATYYHLTLSGSNTVTMPGTAMTVSGNFTMSGTASTTAARALTVVGNFTVGAGTTFAASTYSHSVGGNFSNSGTFTANTSTFTFNGAAAQSLTGATTFYNVTMNNTSTGLTIANNVTVSNTLAFTDGVITTDTNTLITSLACNTPSVTGASQATGWVAGNLQKRIPTGTPVSCTFEIGDATTYRPINTTFASVTTAGNVTGWSSQSAGDHPDTTNLLSGIDPLYSVNRYWTLTNSGTVFTTCSATFNYVAGDLDAGALYTSFIVALGSTCSGSGATRTCTSWTQPTVGTLGATSTQATGLTAFGDFAVGQARNPNFSREPQFIYTRERY